jgi:hypothetical protein
VGSNPTPRTFEGYWGLLAFLEHFRAFKLGDVLESGFYEFAGFFQIPCDLRDELVVMNVYQVRVDQGILDVFVAENIHDVEDVSCAVVFHCGFPVA